MSSTKSRNPRHRIAHWLGWNGCISIDMPSGHCVVCLGCGEVVMQVTRRSAEEYEALRRVLGRE